MLFDLLARSWSYFWAVFAIKVVDPIAKKIHRKSYYFWWDTHWSKNGGKIAPKQFYVQVAVALSLLLRGKDINSFWIFYYYYLEIFPKLFSFFWALYVRRRGNSSKKTQWGNNRPCFVEMNAGLKHSNEDNNHWQKLRICSVHKWFLIFCVYTYIYKISVNKKNTKPLVFGF